VKNQLVRGTIILTGAGIVTRIIGFGYRILLAGALGETKLGIYQLIFPVYSICFTLYAAGIQTAVSQLISHEKEEKHPSILKSGCILSLCISCSLSLLLNLFAEQVGTSFLGTNETVSLLHILAVIFPFCGITSIINGYFYGISNAKVPASSQIIEQLFRVGFVCGAGYFVMKGDITKELAVMGLVAGELAANIYNFYRLSSHLKIKQIIKSPCRFRHLFRLALPLSGNKLVISLLASLESVLIPAMLVKYGFEKEEALAIFGILTGIVMPFLMFPGTITNSLSVLLLPAISRAAGKNNHMEVKRTTETTMHYSLLLGVFTTSVFSIYGQSLGNYLFQSSNAGKLLTLLAVICPFLYGSTTLTSVINGLGKTGVTFFNTILGLAIRILCLIFLTPSWGIHGYLIGIVLSQIAICLLNGIYISRKTDMQYHIVQNVIWPLVFSVSTLIVAKKGGSLLTAYFPPILSEGFGLLAGCLLILFYFYKSNQIRVRDFRK
jgi:stage V sporulation protein B